MSHGMDVYDLEAVKERLRAIKYSAGWARDRNAARCYLAGPMSGMPDFNVHAFAQVAEIIRSSGWEVFNPAEEDIGNGFMLAGTSGDQAELEGFDFRMAMATDLGWILRHADVVFVMPGWEESTGGWLEWFVSQYMGIPVYSYPGMRRIDNGY